ncbi:ribokinase [Petrotoga mexicana DSM 14811]|uniref:Ribokinase n=1 Tax=Petrotoga mexicana DSM 14811 TaxID=1122954 RepID=A0A2K1PCE7_9BACT|nr:1-phosphofructokinase family hexose kinase [Petrotoga mexicana]PNS00459.1 ribokinase [Petrotoga mexicana DSM 14811]
MIFTITLNPCLDRYLYVDKLKTDDTTRVKKIKDYPAGKGIDVSRAIKELDGKSVAISFLGGENGRKIEEMLDREGVIYTAVRITKETRMNIILQEQSSQYRLSVQGPKIPKTDLNQLYETLKLLIRENDTVVISGSLPRGVTPNFYAEIISYLKGKNARIYFDADGENLKVGVESHPDCIKPNLYEFQRVLGKKINGIDKDQLAKYGLDLIDKYGIKEILLTLGSEGAIFISKESCLYAPSIDVPVQSAVGSGDSFLAAYVLKREEGANEEEAFKWANASGNASVMTPGTELCRKNDVLRLLDEIKIEKIF